jgi:CheY-like chemotaxis protein
MPGKRILVVDDEPAVGLSIKFALEGAGHFVEIVNSGQEALRKFEVEKYDVVLTDFMMAGMTGVQLAERIKWRSPAQPIILFSGFPPFPPTTAIDLVILKPSSPAELRAAVEKLSERNRNTPAKGESTA